MQSTQTSELLHNALDRIAFLESALKQEGTEFLRLSAELDTANELVVGLKGSVKGLEKEIRDGERALKGEQEKVRCEVERGRKLEEDLKKEQQQLTEVNGQLGDANERVKAMEAKLDEIKLVGGKEGKELVDLREENESLRSEVGKLKREKERLQVRLYPLKMPWLVEGGRG